MSGTCRFCGCSETKPCLCGCAWTDEKQDLCSNCLEMIRMLADWACDCHQPSSVLLAREAKLLYEKARAADRLLVATPEEVRTLAAGGAR
jgi:hypothetical protein